MILSYTESLIQGVLLLERRYFKKTNCGSHCCMCSPIVYHLIPSWMPNEKYHLILTQGSGDKKTGLSRLLSIF